MDANEAAESGRKLIEDIRRNEYMIGLDMPPEANAAAGRLREQLGKALQLLAADLYANETHFLLELIQNADDNRYSDEVVPTVRVELTSGQFVFFNNETGFAEENVRALCGVGKSTKAKDKKSGFIGEKGIGFKSVFQVSEKPEIHSNGFHFFFDMSKTDDLLGYVVPNWKLPDVHTESAGTTIVLPAKPSQAFTGELLAQLNPKLMLFLRRLRRVELRTDAGWLAYERRDTGNLVSVFMNDRAATESAAHEISEDYLRFSIAVDMTTAVDDKREGVTRSELVLAFPLDAAGRALAEAGKEVFAFLPIRNFGFRFYVQGDFLLSSSREDILEGRLWNQRLRNSIAPAFVAAIEQFKGASTVANGYLNYLPGADEITHEFFKPVVKQLISALADVECVPCATGEWRKPSDVMLVPTGFDELVSPEEALTLFGKDYPSPAMTVSRETLKRIGCKPALGSDIVAMFEEHAAWSQDRGVEWMIGLYRFVARLPRETLLESGLAKARVVLDENGELQSTATRRIFYPLVPGRTFGFEHELTICHAAISKVLDEEDGLLRGFFNDVGVCRADPYQLITGHILPLHENDGWKTAGRPPLIGHLRYVKAVWPEYLAGAKAHGVADQAAWSKLRDGLRIGTKEFVEGRWTFWFAQQMYLSCEYAPAFDVESILGDKISQSRLVSPLYLTGIDGTEVVGPEELGSWKEFLFALGVNPSPRVRRAESGDVRCSEELDLLLGSSDVATRRVTLECLDRNWSRYLGSIHYAPKGRPTSSHQLHSLVVRLRATNAPSMKRREARLDASFLDSPQLREAFGDAPNYVDAHLENETFLDACGIRYRPDIDTCVARLLQLKAAGHTGLPEVRRIYRLLERLHAGDPTGVRQAFRDNPLILTRATDSPWKLLHEVVWAQQGEFLGALFPSLQGQYPDFHTFFRKLGVPNELPVSALIRALPQLVAVDLLPEDRVGEAMRIYARANRELVSPNGDGSRPAWFAEFADGCSFLTARDTMVTCDDRLFIDDKPALAALFRDKGGIEFVAVPQSRLPQVRDLLIAAGVPTLSSEVTLRLENPGRGRRNELLVRRIRERHGLIARLVYSNSHAVFSRAVEAGKWTTLAALLIEEVDNLTVRVELRGEAVTMTGDVVIEGAMAYVRAGVKGVVDRLAVDICLLLGAASSITDGISRILSEPDFAGAEEFLEVKGVPELPDEERDRLLSDGLTAEHADDGELGADFDADEPDEPALTQDEAWREAGATVANSPERRTPDTVSDGSRATRAPASRVSDISGPAHEDDDSGAAKPVDPNRLAASSGSLNHRPFGQAPGGAAPNPLRYSPIPSGLSAQFRLRRFGVGGGRARGQEGWRRLISYVEPADGSSPPGSTDTEALEAQAMVERAAVKFFIDTQSANWRSLEEMPSHNQGFDIKSVSLDGREHYIEIKGQSGAWTAAGIAMTPAEILCAAQHRDLYWLCVVEHALDANRRRMHMVKNPFGSAGQFRYDSGWKDVAVSERSAALVPAEGLRVEIHGIGSGEVLRVVKSGGLFSRIEVRLDNGTEVVQIFHPAKMKLSKAE